ncbi:MAG: NAD(P)-dependent oxidoreductase [Phycisphaeraceae bacterium]
MSDDRPRVVVTETLAEPAERWLSERAEVVRCPLDGPAKLGDALGDAAGLVVRTYTQVDEALLDAAPGLRVVGRGGVGLDNIDVAACARRGVRVVYTPEANTQAVVEYVVGLMLDAHRPRTNLPARADGATFHGLRKTEVGQQLDHFTLGIMGFGRVGQRLGRVAQALGMKLLVCDVLPEAQLRNAVEYPFAFVAANELYAGSDIVSIHVDGRASNHHLVGADAMARLKPSCLLINSSRGFVVDAAALAAWLKAHPAARAVLDVHEPEPPGPDYPLWNVANARLLPHLASRTEQALANMSWVVRDVWAVLRGREPWYSVEN